ncbi:MAG: hypothetical protein ACI4WS_07925 [Oscillospiraceae bacterium]
MAEQKRNGLSVSFRLDSGIVEHNNREFIAKNVVRERIPDNITYKRENIREFYNQLFGQALAEYNARKAHPYQRIPDYYEHIRKGKQEKPYDYMRGEIINRDEQIAALSKQVNSTFVPFEIYSEEKMQYVADGLTRAKIPFIEESRLLYIPEYAVKTANVISSHYQPANGGTIREQIALDIDRLIYTSSSVENLLNKLKERGYEIKQGKYLAVKAPFAERYVRLKSLGDDYLPKMLEKRISSNGTYVRKVRERMSRSNEVEKKICAMVLETSVAIQQFRIIPKKTKPQKTYTFSNDDNLNLLVEQLSTIGELGITSRDGIYEKAAELKKSIEDKTEELKALSDEAPTLKTDIAQIRFYFENAQNRRRLDAMGQVKLAAAKEAAEKHGVRSEQDVAALEERLKLLPSYIKTIQHSITEEQAKLKRINQLADVYEKVVVGNYIDNLIREQRELEQKTLKK